MAVRAIAGLVVCALFGGCQQNNPLEMRVSRLEQKVTQLEAESRKRLNEDAEERQKFESCVKDADTTYRQDIERNGTRIGRTNDFSVPASVLAELRRIKAEKLDECKLLYPR